MTRKEPRSIATRISSSNRRSPRAAIESPAGEAASSQPGRIRGHRRTFSAKGVVFGVNPTGLVARMPCCVLGADSSLRAIVFGYACHCTTLGGSYYKVNGDWAGYAQGLEEYRRDGPFHHRLRRRCEPESARQPRVLAPARVGARRRGHACAQGSAGGNSRADRRSVRARRIADLRAADEGGIRAAAPGQKSCGATAREAASRNAGARREADVELPVSGAGAAIRKRPHARRPRRRSGGRLRLSAAPRIAERAALGRGLLQRRIRLRAHPRRGRLRREFNLILRPARGSRRRRGQRSSRKSSS